MNKGLESHLEMRLESHLEMRLESHHSEMRSESI